jgi:hypothetical protein
LRSLDELPPLAELSALEDLDPQLDLPVADALEIVPGAEQDSGVSAANTDAYAAALPSGLLAGHDAPP